MPSPLPLPLHKPCHLDDHKFIKDYEYAIKIIFGQKTGALLMHMHPVTLKVTKLYTQPLRVKYGSLHHYILIIIAKSLLLAPI
jgi:hypothetical protein